RATSRARRGGASLGQASRTRWNIRRWRSDRRRCRRAGWVLSPVPGLAGDQDRQVGMRDEPVGKPGQDEPAAAAAAMVAGDDQVEAMLVRIPDQVVGRLVVFALDEHLLERDTGPVGAVAGGQEALLEEPSRRLDRLSPVLLGLGVRGRVR